MKVWESVRTISVVLRNMLVGGNLASLSLMRKPQQASVYTGETLFLYKAMTAGRGLTEKNVFEVLSGKSVEAIELACKREGFFFGTVASYLADLVSICLICKIIKPKVVFEIGTLKGCVAYHLALNTEDDAKVYTLDLPRDGSVQSRLHTTLMDDVHIAGHRRTHDYVFDGSAVASKVNCLFGDSASFDFSPFLGKVDFFFIDGAHSYDYVRSDTLNAIACSHPGSVIAWHDFGRVGVNGVSKWLIELSKTCEVFTIPGGSLAFMVVK
jgi:Methyltransferase domain